MHTKRGSQLGANGEVKGRDPRPRGGRLVCHAASAAGEDYVTLEDVYWRKYTPDNATLNRLISLKQYINVCLVNLKINKALH